MIYTYSQTFTPNDLIFEMSKESAQIYNKAIQLSKKGVDFKEVGKIIDKEFKEHFLLAQSRQGSYQQFYKDFKTYFEALKSYKVHPGKFSGQPKPPHKERFLKPIYFKNEAIKRKNGNLLLSTKKPNDPIEIKWNNNLPLPKYASIVFDKHTGWKINFTIETDNPIPIPSTNNKTMAIDLGVKRIATTFDGEKCTTYSGKEFLALGKLRNKLQAATQIKYANTKKESRRRKYLKRALRKNVRKIKNKEKDILHKYSRTIVNDAIKNGVKTIAIGDCSNIHNKTNLGKENNQKIQQNPEQKLKDYVVYKFQSTEGITKVIPERRTSKTCPKCGHIHKNSPVGRIFTCKNCGYIYDRDGVGSINIYSLEVSFDHDKWLNVIGRMTLPLGLKYHPNLPCRNWQTNSEPVACCQGKETTTL